MKTIIKTTAEANGAHDNHCGEFEIVPVGYVEIPEEFMSTWGQYKPFVIPTITDGVIEDLICNTSAWEAWEAWKASLPTPQPPQPTTEERLSATEAAITALMGV